MLDPVLQVRVDGKMVTKELDPHLSGLYLMFGFISYREVDQLVTAVNEELDAHFQQLGL